MRVALSKAVGVWVLGATVAGVGVPAAFGQTVTRIDRWMIRDMTPDGRMATGDISSNNHRAASTWTAVGGINAFAINDPGIPGTTVLAHAISGNGTTVFGQCYYTPDTGPYRYRGMGTFQRVDIGSWPQITWDQSSYDGQSACGWVWINTAGTPMRAFRWTASGGIQYLGSGYESHAEGMSSDGGTIAGYSYNGAGTYSAWVWTTSRGMQTLENFDSSETGSFAYGLSADGHVVVGGSGSIGNAVYWRDGRLVNLGKYSGASYCVGESVSFDGSLIVGSALISGIGNVSFVWTQAHGMELMSDYFRRLGVTFSDTMYFGGGEWRVCADGRTFYGREGSTSYIVSIPSPWSAFGLLGGVWASHRRRRP